MSFQEEHRTIRRASHHVDPDASAHEVLSDATEWHLRWKRSAR